MAFSDIFKTDDAVGGGGADAGTVLGVLGAGLLSGDRYHLFGDGMSTAVALANRDAATGTSRAALKQLLINAGAPPEEAEKFSANEKVAGLALAALKEKRQAAFGQQLGTLLGGGDAPAAPVSNLGMAPPAPGGPAAGVSLNGSQTDKAKAVYEGLTQRGLSPVLAAGMTGNIGAESGFNPGAVGDNGSAFGYHQARADRADNLRTIAQQRGVAWNDHDAQLDNIAAEFGGKDAGMAKAKALIEADPNMTPERAAEIIARLGERPAASALASSLPKRAGTAAQVFSLYGKGAPVKTADASGAMPNLPSLAGQPAPAELGVGNNLLNTPSRQAASEPNAADLPAADAKPAGFEIPPGQGAQSVSPTQPITTGAPPQMAAATKRAAALAAAAMNPVATEAQQKLLLDERKRILDQIAPTETSRQLVEAGYTPGTDAYKEAYRKKLGIEKDDRPTSIREAEAVIKDPSIKDTVLEMKRSSATSVTVGGQEKTYDADQGKNYSAKMTALQDAGEKAPLTIATLSEAERLMNTPGFVSGVGTEKFILPFKQIAAKLGGDPNAPAAMESVRSLTNKAVTDQLGGSLGAGVSNADVSFLQKQNASLDNSVEANKTLIGYAKRLAERQVQVAELARDYAGKNNGRLDLGFQRELAAWAKANPVFPEAKEADAAKPAPEKPAPTIAPPQTTTDKAATIAQAKAYLQKFPEKRDILKKRLDAMGVPTDAL